MKVSTFLVSTSSRITQALQCSCLAASLKAIMQRIGGGGKKDETEEQEKGCEKTKPRREKERDKGEEEGRDPQ